MSTNPAWTVRQVAEYFCVNERTVYRMAKPGELPAFKVVDAWRFQCGEIDEWIVQQQQQRAGNSIAKAKNRTRGGRR